MAILVSNKNHLYGRTTLLRKLVHYRQLFTLLYDTVLNKINLISKDKIQILISLQTEEFIFQNNNNTS